MPVTMDVETLVAADPSIYRDHKTFLNTNDDIAIFEHIRTYYAHTFNGVWYFLFKLKFVFFLINLWNT